MTHSNRWSIFASAMTLIAAGPLAVPAPAQADNPPCQQWGFGGTTNIVVNGNTVASFNANGPSFSGSASAGNLTVPTSAVVHENNFIEISQHMPWPEGSGGAEQSYNGVVGPDGIAHGTSSNTSPIVQG